MAGDDKSKFDVPISGHEYDGIQEFDNPLPGWWLITFYGTIIFAALYWGYYELGPGPSLKQELQSDLTKIESLRGTKTDKGKPSGDSVDVKAVLNDSKALEIGKKHFVGTCSACHGQKGEGLIGPNLTDAYWINGKGQLKDILKSIREGFPSKGMPPWGQIVPAEDHVPLAAYVISLQGTNPPNAKGPQGEKVEE